MQEASRDCMIHMAVPGLTGRVETVSHCLSASSCSCSLHPRSLPCNMKMLNGLKDPHSINILNWSFWGTTRKKRSKTHTLCSHEGLYSLCRKYEKVSKGLHHRLTPTWRPSHHPLTSTSFISANAAYLKFERHFRSTGLKHNWD